MVDKTFDVKPNLFSSVKLIKDGSLHEASIVLQ
jgi:hypothetical protein